MRNTLLGALGFSLIILAAPPAFSQSAPIPDTAWEQFLEGSYSPYGDTTVPTWEDKLYVLVEAHPEGADILPRFAEALGVPVGQAEIYARLIVGSVLRREQQTGDCEPDCLFVPGSDLYELARAHAPMETSGELLYAIGENLFSRTTRAEQAAYLDLVLTHPARPVILSRLYSYTEDAALLTFLVLRDPAAPAVLDAVRGSAIRISSYEPDDWGGWLETSLATGLEKLAQSGAAPDDQAAYVQLLASRYLAQGLRERALDLYLGQPEAVRERLPLAPACAGERNCGGQSLWFVDEMSAALWLDGRQEEADALLARTPPELEALRDTEALQRRAALDDAMRPTRPDASLFDVLVDGDPALIRKDDHPSFGGVGWFSLRPGPAGSLLLTKRVRTAGYTAMAEDMARRPGIYRSAPEHWHESLIAAVEGRFSPEFVARRRALSQDIEQAWEASPDPETHIRPSTPSLLPEWREARLPPGVAPWVDDRTPDGDDGPSPTADALPDYLSPYSVIRHERAGDQHVVLFESSEYDLPGELPAFGLWLVRTEGGEWRPPVYLGLQQHFPYVATGGSKLPLVVGDRVQMEVQVREIDPESIIFPPVALALRREEDGVMLVTSLTALERDSDNDGLTDIAERHLGLDPFKADTDGDGLIDGTDSLPLTPHAAPDPVRDALAAAILKNIVGYEAGALVVEAAPDPDDDPLGAMAVSATPPGLETVIMAGDGEVFAGMDLPFRLLIYSPEVVARMARQRGPFYPPEIKMYPSLDGLTHLVIWSAGWVGGTFVVRCDRSGACETEVRSSWIT